MKTDFCGCAPNLCIGDAEAARLGHLCAKARYQRPPTPFPFDATAGADERNPYGKITVTDPNSGKPIRLYLAEPVDAEIARLRALAGQD